jgi:hypothetical protein
MERAHGSGMHDEHDGRRVMAVAKGTSGCARRSQERRQPASSGHGMADGEGARAGHQWGHGRRLVWGVGWRGHTGRAPVGIWLWAGVWAGRGRCQAGAWASDRVRTAAGRRRTVVGPLRAAAGAGGGGKSGQRWQQEWAGEVKSGSGSRDTGAGAHFGLSSQQFSSIKAAQGSYHSNFRRPVVC